MAQNAMPNPMKENVFTNLRARAAVFDLSSAVFPKAGFRRISSSDSFNSTRSALGRPTNHASKAASGLNGNAHFSIPLPGSVDVNSRFLAFLTVRIIDPFAVDRPARKQSLIVNTIRLQYKFESIGAQRRQQEKHQQHRAECYQDELPGCVGE